MNESANMTDIAGRIFPDLIVPVVETTQNATTEICQPLSEPYLLVVSVAPALVTVENLVFLIAVLLYRKKLKHNNVYKYVTSALFANVVTSVWAFYHFLNYYYGIESAKPTNWWAFRKGMTAGFSLILCGNIGLLIYAIEDNAYMIGRLVSGISNGRRNNQLNARVRMHRALYLIAITWILPVLYGLLSMTKWNCRNHCTCTLHHASGSPICVGEKCSRLYTPMSKSYLLCIVIIWAVECSFLLIMIIRSAMSPFTPNMSQSNRSDTIQSTELNGDGDASNNNSKHIVTSYGRFLPRLRNKYKFPLILLGLFVCCTAPVMVLFVLDFAVADFKSSSATVNIVTPLPLLYCVVSPILLMSRLPGMKSAVYMFLTFSWLKTAKSKRARLSKSKQRGSASSVGKNSECKMIDSKATP